MTAFQRKSYLKTFTEALKHEKTIILTWARQVGKTTLLKQFQEQQKDQVPCLYVNCEDYFETRFSNFKEFCTWILTEFNFDVNKKGIIMLDEVQSRNDPDRLLKSYHDSTSTKATMIATWSRFWWQKTLWASMVGRGKKIHIFWYSFEEYLEIQGMKIKNMKNITYAMIQEHLKQYLTWGWYPAVVHANSREKKIQNIKDIMYSWIQKDFGYFLANKYRPDFLRLMQYIAHNTWSLAKVEQLAQYIWFWRKIVEEMISFMEESFVIQQVYPYFTNKSKEYTSLPKIYFHDIGLLHYLTWIFESTDFDGKITETFVHTTLWRQYDAWEVFYYKKKNMSEIDFIFQKNDGKLIPIEVKTWDRTTTPEIFHRFDEQYHDKVEKYIQTTKSIEKKIKENFHLELMPFWKLSI